MKTIVNKYGFFKQADEISTEYLPAVYSSEAVPVTSCFTFREDTGNGIDSVYAIFNVHFVLVAAKQSEKKDYGIFHEVLYQMFLEEE